MTGYDIQVHFMYCQEEGQTRYNDSATGQKIFSGHSLIESPSSITPISVLKLQTRAAIP